MQTSALTSRILLLATLSISLMEGLALAAKPGGSSVPAGRIYYRWQSEIYADLGGPPYEFRGYWSMNADGTGKMPNAYQPAGDRHHLSYLVHQGHRWYLEIARSSTYDKRSALFAVRDDGAPEFTELLLEFAELPGDPGAASCRWAQDDSFVSFVVRAPGATTLAELWAAEIAFDDTIGVPALVTPPLPVLEGEQPGWNDLASYDWSPDGTQVVYGLEPNGDVGAVKIKDLASGQTRTLAERSYDPVWSPNGARIALKSFNEGVHTIKPDGSGLVRVTSNSWDTPTGWSPDSQHIVFWRGGYYKGSGTTYIADVFRVSATGGSAINLTKDIDGYATSTGWR